MEAIRGGVPKRPAKAPLIQSERERLSSSIRGAMGAMTCVIAAQLYRRLIPGQSAPVSFIYFIGILIIGIPIAIRGVKGFLQRELSGADSLLVTIAMTICMLSGQYVVAILIPMLLTLVHFLEEKSIIGGQEAIDGLRKLQSDTAIRIKDGEEAEVSARELEPGDVILVKPGMSFPIDGVVLTGTSSVNAQSLTGESLPIDVSPSERVYAGTLNMQGALTVSVEKKWTDASFQKIVRMLEETTGADVPESRIIDLYMAYYIPLMLALATIVWFITGDISRAAAVLVVSCPCGQMLVSSAPLIASIAVASKRGVLIRNASFIEKLSQSDAVFFDKTGTITSGDIIISAYEPASGVSTDELCAAALTLARRSSHPLSKAIVKRMKDYQAEEGYEIQERGGMGVVGTRGGSVILLGNETLLAEYGAQAPASREADGISSHVARDGRYLGRIGFSDAVRDDAKEVIERLKGMGIVKTCLLTGDKYASAERLRAELGIDEVKAQVLPEEKQRIIREVKRERKVVFVGDGVNDALALSEADVGVAMAEMGNDAAIQSADISLINNNLNSIAYII
ncbi:MAG: cadmium-translocating P-type ATPase, partial [Oscillospiraceae bacterium]|nr:cadmium-translocating P-type ATPase [Oscillospiraceae bacterium]